MNTATATSNIQPTTSAAAITAFDAKVTDLMKELRRSFIIDSRARNNAAYMTALHRRALDSGKAYVAITAWGERRVQIHFGPVGHGEHTWAEAAMAVTREAARRRGLLATGDNVCTGLVVSWDATKDIEEASRRLLPNREIPAGLGRIEDVAALLQRWFPTHTLEAIETVPAGDAPHADHQDTTAYLMFNLMVKCGRTYYATSMSYKSFAEGTIGEKLGAVDAMHYIRTEILAIIDRCQKNEDPTARLPGLRLALEAIPMMGWRVSDETNKAQEPVKPDFA